MKTTFVAEEQRSSDILRRIDEKEKRLKVSNEKEKEKTKMRERHRRSITTQILSGLRKHGNYNLPPRADINDVLRALATEAGWIVEADGTTYRNPACRRPLSSGGGYSGLLDYAPVNLSSSNPGSLTAASLTPVPSGSSLNSLGGFGYALPPLNLDTIDCAAGECSTTSSPRHLSNANFNLMQSGRSPYIANEESPQLHVTGTLPCLGSLSNHYVLSSDASIFALQEDVAAADVYFPTGMPAQCHPEASGPISSGLPFESSTLNTSECNLCPTHSGPFQYKPGLSLPSMLLYPPQYSQFLQESKASNQNTPISSPQPHRGAF